MGPTQDVDIAKFLAEQAETEAERAANEAVAPEWRWSRTGWGEWGEKPALYAMGMSARRSARSRARWKSRWLENRSRPRLA